MLTNQELNDFLESCRQLEQSLGASQVSSQIMELENQRSLPEFWQDPAQAGKINKQITALQNKIERIQAFRRNLDNLKAAFELGDEAEFEIQYKSSKSEYDELQNETFLSGPFDKSDCLLSVHAGAGGVDAQDFAAMLTSMYQAFCHSQNWDHEIISLSQGDEAGLKSVTLKIDGLNAYGLLKEEAGVHRLVRISPFNAGKTRETSFALVEVMPQGLDLEIDVQVDEKDLKWDYFMSSGKGGQSVNTTYSAVRVVHLPTGLSATCQNERSQSQNKVLALKYLKNKLAAIELQKQKEYAQEIKGEFKSAEWGNQIRNYVLHPYKLVKDVRSGWESSSPEKVLEEGQILPIIWSVKQTMRTK
jgi:peptide chain release factor 2